MVKPTLDISIKVGQAMMPYRKLSGGQRLYADLYFLTKMIDMIGGIGLLLLDEAFKYFSYSYLQEAFKLITESKINHCILIYHGELPDVDARLVNANLSEDGISEYRES